METIVTSELETLDVQVSRLMRETPSYQLPDGEVVYLREECWIKPLVDVWECEFSKDMFGLIWKPVKVPGWTEIDGVYILDEYVNDVLTGYTTGSRWIPYEPGEVGVMDVYPTMAAWVTIMDRRAAQVIVDNDFWRSRSELMWSAAIRRLNTYQNGIQRMVEGVEAAMFNAGNDFSQAVCPICGEATCDHYDDHEPLFKSAPTIGG